MQGILNVGDPMATPIIKQLRTQLDQSKIVILDSPPGTSCPVIETVRGSDYCILVTEPTPFGLHDLQLAVATVRELHVPFGVIINCAGIGDDAVEVYCSSESIPLLMKIPWDRRIAEGYSRGEPVVAVSPELKQQFQNLYATITSAVNVTA
jgi:MinD superfamily P-loop ATPase